MGAPFVDQPSPPKSTVQPVKEANLRGDDFGLSPTDDEYVRAIAYRAHIVAISRSKYAHLLMLKGSRSAWLSLQRKTLALSSSAPPYIEADV